MNCCWLLILLFLCGGNGFGSSSYGCNGNNRSRNDRNDSDRDRDRDRDCGCGREEERGPRFDSGRHDDDMMQSRGFAGFSSMGTCGCEEKSDNDNDC